LHGNRLITKLEVQTLQMVHKTSRNMPASEHKSEKKVICISCGAVITKNYCEECGEKRLTSHDLTLVHYTEEIFEGFTHFDNKFFRSIKILLTKPGLLSENYCTGKRIEYMRPFAFFFVSNLLFFFIIGQYNVFSLPLDSFYHYKPYTNFHTKEIIERLAPNEESFAIIATRFNEKMGVQSKAFLAFFIPFLALGGVMLRRKMFVSAHLVFSTHYLSFIVLYYTLTSPLSKIYYVFTKQIYNSTFDLTYSLFSLLVFITYYVIAAKRFYKLSAMQAMFGAIVTTILFLVVLYGYRFLLFFKIINSIGGCVFC
jgi:hypothetical protein